MSIRTQAKRRMRDRSLHHVYVGSSKLRKGNRYEFRAHKDGVTFLTGWFIADSNNPVCHVL